MPQIAQLAETYSSQIFWLLLVFGFIFFVVGRGMVPKVIATVDDRNARIASDLAAAEAARAEADAQEEAWRLEENKRRGEAQAIIAAAKAKASRDTEAKLAKANDKITAQLAEADARIAEARGKALGEIEAVAAESAQAIADKVAGLKVGAADAKAAVKGVMANV